MAHGGESMKERAMAKRGKQSDVQFLYLTTTGRITGQPREIEIWFVVSEGKLYILAEHFHKAQWVKNIERNPRVRVRLGEREFEATARVLDRRRDAEAWKIAQQLEREKYGWGDGLPVEIVTDEPL
jgi:deazaflavin-dependent oxidoreductase (nitroreductase family)